MSILKQVRKYLNDARKVHEWDTDLIKDEFSEEFEVPVRVLEFLKIDAAIGIEDGMGNLHIYQSCRKKGKGGMSRVKSRSNITEEYTSYLVHMRHDAVVRDFAHKYLLGERYNLYSIEYASKRIDKGHTRDSYWMDKFLFDALTGAFARDMKINENVALVESEAKKNATVFMSLREGANVADSFNAIKIPENLVDKISALELDVRANLDSLESNLPVLARAVDSLVNDVPKFALRSRLVGRHKALAVYHPHKRNIAVSAWQADSLVHEWAHHYDLARESHLSASENFSDILKKVRAEYHRLQDEVGAFGRKLGYYCTPTEVFARGFELYSSKKFGLPIEKVSGVQYDPIKKYEGEVVTYFESLAR